jgi:glycosyltransferase involved in cell wall biosynthesis
VCAEVAALLSGRGSDAHVIFSVDGGTLHGAPGGADANTAPSALAAARLARLAPGARFGVDLSASVDVAAAADVVIVSTVAPAQLDWMRRFRARAPTHAALVWWVHEGQSVMHQWPADFTAAVADVMTSELVDALIFPSASTEVWWRDIIKARGSERGGILPSFIRALPWGLPSWRLDALDSAVAQGAAVRAALRVPPSAFVFLVVASYNPLKGHRGIVKAFARARAVCGGGGGGGGDGVGGSPNAGARSHDLHLITVGVALGAQPHYFPQEDFAWVRSDPAVHLLGETDAVPDYLAAADAYVSNTLDGGETWGLATLEALAAGVPVLSSRVGGAVEMLRDGETALLHDVPVVGDDSEEAVLAEHMCRLVNESALRTDIGARGRAHARASFGQAYLKASLDGVFGSLGAGRRRAVRG